MRHACVVMHVGVANTRWRGKRSRHSWRMRNPQFYLSGKRPMRNRLLSKSSCCCNRTWMSASRRLVSMAVTVSMGMEGLCASVRQISRESRALMTWMSATRYVRARITSSVRIRTEASTASAWMVRIEMYRGQYIITTMTYKYQTWLTWPDDAMILQHYWCLPRFMQ